MTTMMTISQTSAWTKTKLEQPDATQFSRLLSGECYDPFALLGLHSLSDGTKVVRIWRPGAQNVSIQLENGTGNGSLLEATQIHEAGLFECIVPPQTTTTDYRIFHQNGLLSYDPYSFTPTFQEVDQYLFGQGTHYDIYRVMGANRITHQGVAGVQFTVWAPNAKAVSLVADFNYWDGRVNPMRSLGGSGVWELFIPGLDVGEKYKFEVRTTEGKCLIKADPYAKASECRPSTASVVSDPSTFSWSDHDWMERRYQQRTWSRPFNCYEVHLGSWMMKDGQFMNYKELAHKLVAYCQEMGFTHIELLPIAEHPFDESWGYQITGYYSVTSRYGSPADFQYFVDHLHKNDIGVILDWVPGHFPSDDFALARFDGSALYEHIDPRQGYHPHWDTLIFNYGRPEVSNFLIANALYWFDQMHIDGLRVDAVASMLYLDYGREEGEWLPNCYGGKENLEAIELIKHLNSIVHERYPGVLMIAEESTSFTGVTCPVKYNGLGFDLKWNMGWMNDTLRYFSKDSLYRHYHHNDLTFGLLYAFTEKFCLVLSHDEVVHGKGNLLSKMPGDMWQQFANLRLLYTYMVCQPGKNLLFMGGEFGQWNEWDCKREIEWDLLQFPTHKGAQTLVKEMNHFAINHPSLWERDFDGSGFEWVDFSDSTNSVISYQRKSSDEQLFIVHNLTPTYHPEYFISLSNLRYIRELFNSDDERYGGSGKRNEHIEIVRNTDGHPVGIHLALAPLATMIFEIEFQ